MRQLETLIVKPLNHVLGSAPWAVERLRRHAGAHLTLLAGPFELALCIDGEGLLQPSQGAESPDVSIELAADFPARLLFDRESLMSSARLGGSADVAETLAFVFRNLRWDAEADLAGVVGDIPARRVSLAGARLVSGVRAGASRLAANFAEYASDESELLASRQNIERFLGEVDRLRDETARIEKRIARLGG